MKSDNEQTISIRLFIRRFSAEQVGVSLGQTFKEVTEEKDVDNKESDVSTTLTNVSSDIDKLLLKWGNLWLDNEFSDNLSEARLFTDHKAHESTFTACNVGA